MTTRPPRMLIYSHDLFGLGHLRRCRAIAQSLVAYREDLSILMIAGSPIVGAFSFSPNVDFIRVPGVVKLANESYQPHAPGLSIEDVMEIRSAIILETARVFEPDIFLVDKEPLGLRGEVEATLDYLKKKRQAPRARPPRRDGRTDAARRGMGAQASGAGARGPLRPHLDIRHPRDLRSARRHRRLERRPARRRASPATSGAARRPPASIPRRMRSRSRSISSPPAAAATARCWSTGY